MNAIAIEPPDPINDAIAALRSAGAEQTRLQELQHSLEVSVECERKRLVAEQAQLDDARTALDLASYLNEPLRPDLMIQEDRAARCVRHITHTTLPSFECALSESASDLGKLRIQLATLEFQLYRAQIPYYETRCDRDSVERFPANFVEILARDDRYGDPIHDNDPQHRQRRALWNARNAAVNDNTPRDQLGANAPLLLAARERLRAFVAELLNSEQ